MKKIILLSISIIAMLITLTMLAIVPAIVTQSKSHTDDSLLLLIPDENVNSLMTEGWKNIAAEEGLHLDIQTDTEFLLPYNQQHVHRHPGIILPDSIHEKMSLSLAESLKDYVKNGGQLMLIYDAGTRNLQGKPYKKGALFSDMLHLQYGAGKGGIENAPVGQNKRAMDELGIPPGKCIIDEESNISIPDDLFCAISSYGYGALTYPHFVTKPVKQNIPLLLTTLDHQFIAGSLPFGQGQVLFINLPLTHLWWNTDAMPMHLFLHYFAIDMLGLPALSMVPNGVGGLILNLHVEAKDALIAFPLLKRIGLFQQGPYSIDFTVGPDLDRPGDNNGFDIINNPEATAWIKELAGMGHAIGSDGGWMHNYFGLNVNETNQRKFENYITRNNQAIEKVLEKKVVEYVPSMGNQPAWVNKYLGLHGFLGYYSTSNIGSSPTRNFRNGVFDNSDLWSFPCLTLGLYANFRDFGFAHLSEERVSNWLIESSEFSAKNHTSRLIYFHPSDILFFSQYINSIKNLLTNTKNLSTKGLFQWYSMIDLAQFLNARNEVYWQVKNINQSKIITATHPITLARQTWLLDKKTCFKPLITVGAGIIREDKDHWIVSAKNSKSLQFKCHIPRKI